MALYDENKEFEIGEKVVVLDEVYPIIYIIGRIENDICEIKGYNYRIFRIVKRKMLRKATDEEITKEEQKSHKYALKVQSLRSRQERKYIIGKVLHVDGDNMYLNKCLELYKETGVYAFGLKVDEEYMYKEVVKYVLEVNPDVVVLTGHDLFNNGDMKNLDNYTNSKYFSKAIKEIRKVNKDVIIVAGACQSNFEALIASGADFASSPKRINIHTFDPVVIAIKAATTSFTKIIKLEDVYKYIENDRKAFGGLETFGKMRLMI